MSRVPLATVVGLVVTAVWATVFLVDMFSRSYSAPAEVNAVMLVVAGGIYGAAVVKR